jgi:hypothetical protein
MRYPKKATRAILRASKFINQRFGRLIIKEVTDQRSKDGKILVKCLCDCSKEFLTRLSPIKLGHTQSCGCLNQDIILLNLQKAQAKMFKREPRIASARRVYRNRYEDGDLSFEDFLDLSQKDCFYCGAKPCNVYNTYVGKYEKDHPSARGIKDGYFTYNGLDRIDSSLRHTKLNVVACCFRCNTGKMDCSIKDFFFWIEKIYNLHLKDKLNDTSWEQGIGVTSAPDTKQTATRL